MQSPKKYKKYKTTAQIFFWLFSLLFIIFQIRLISEGTVNTGIPVFLKSAFLNACFAVSVYINLNVLIPRFLKNKHYIFYTFWLTVTIFVAALVTQFLFIYPLHFLFTPESRFDTFHSEVFSSFFFAHLVYVAITSFAKFVSDWLVLQDVNLQYNKMQRQKLEAELKSLKAQINPHFLFNSLNNIYSLALSNSKETPRLILMLSDLMRHVLYESKEDFIPLEKEINFVANFIELQKLRLGKNVDLHFTMEGQIPDKQIAPLLFEPFIDNAFKHGLRSPADKPFIRISFTFTENEVFFETRNNYAENLTTPKDKAYGIGLQNVEKRLKFLYRKKDYKLAVNSTDNVFSVLLRLKLKDLTDLLTTR
ncbi:MAG: histidine kinase [Prolixibacteraceae bacterium]|jgi:sensor histidine kinase YesM|nr:histidine kinase [Prolixibacteraceae bacterium]